MCDFRLLARRFCSMVTPLFLLVALGTPPCTRSTAYGDEAAIPEVLKPWQDWVTWDTTNRDCPKLYNNADESICVWPSTLELTADERGGSFKLRVQSFEDTWVTLPGTPSIWPTNVRVDNEPVVVVQRDGSPAIKLAKGSSVLSGEFLWDSMPQRIHIPKEIGMLTLRVSGTEVANPTWDAQGEVWLKRSRSEATDKDLLTLQVYRKIEDGIPLWLRTRIEITVSGKSREESLGSILPLGWQLATVESPIPVAVDELGAIKAQVRAGKWTITLNAFRTHDATDVTFAANANPLVAMELVGLQTDPDFRVSQIEGLPMVDASQTTFPADWRGLPVYQWDVSKPFSLVEKMRGMGAKTRQGLHITRHLWLDEDGNSLTYLDHLNGQMQQIWRLDVADGHDLGAVRVDGEGQLITVNPATGVSGSEIRRRNLQMEAVGRVPLDDELSATGWDANAESLKVTLTTPPGWRVFAVFGADQVRGDWLTAWSLLDLFLLLVFSLAVFRLFGFVGGFVALVAFALSYHEPGAPRITWLLLLMPIALLRVVGEGTLKKWITVWKAVTIVILLFCLVPFIATQVQNVLYPQLEPQGMSYGSRGLFVWSGIGSKRDYQTKSVTEFDLVESSGGYLGRSQSRRNERKSKSSQRQSADESNLNYDPQAMIQTGPAQPQWRWNDVVCIWNGPVAAEQTIHPVLVSLTVNRVITGVRLVLLILLAAILLRKRTHPWPWAGWKIRKAAAAALLGLTLLPASASAQEGNGNDENAKPASAAAEKPESYPQPIPSAEMLRTLRERLLKRSDAFPNAADIPAVELKILDNRLTMNVTLHAAADVAVPLPGRLPAWSPISVTMDGNNDVTVSRHVGYVWIVVPKGIHDITVEGTLGDAAEWEWTFLLKPRRVSIEAPGWKVTGLGPNQVPADQVFFAKEQAPSDEAAAYDRTAFNTVVVIDRKLEIGLVWKVHNTVTRLSATGKAISLEVPLIEGENVLSSGREVKDQSIDVQMGANQAQFSWVSELQPTPAIKLTAASTDRWVERWHLITSPIWNVSISGLPPMFAVNQEALVPIWKPWPGETATIQFSRPAAVVGDTVTAQRVNLSTTLGDRRRTSEMELELECSLANDFVIALEPEIEITSLTLDQQAIPVQRDGANLIIPARPGRQTVAIGWSTAKPLQMTARSSLVTLPVDASNVTTTMVMPENRWILWVDGPLRGPAVRFWTILAVAILIAFVLGSLPMSPLNRLEWVLLSIGLTQVPLPAAMIVVGWLFLLGWRGEHPLDRHYHWRDYLLQGLIVLMTLISLVILFIVVGEGLLGHPDMFIAGNQSWGSELNWFTPRTGAELPLTRVVSISVWFYRLFMLVWALWLAAALLRWLAWGWKQFSKVSEREQVLEATLSTEDAN